jgi:hypothetical protein
MLGSAIDYHGPNEIVVSGKAARSFWMPPAVT